MFWIHEIVVGARGLCGHCRFVYLNAAAPWEVEVGDKVVRSA